jgi:hypothetical protein
MSYYPSDAARLTCSVVVEGRNTVRRRALGLNPNRYQPAAQGEPRSSTTGLHLCVHAADHVADSCILAFDLPDAAPRAQLARSEVRPAPWAY